VEHVGREDVPRQPRAADRDAAIVQLGGDPEEFRTPAGIRAANLSGYTAMVQKRLIKRMYAVPYVTGKIKDAKARYYVALRFSIGRNVSQLMAANPSTLVQLARTLDARRNTSSATSATAPSGPTSTFPPRCARTSNRGRAATEARERTRRARGEARAAVPNGRVADRGHRHQHVDRRSMGPYLRQLPQYYGEPPIHDLGCSPARGGSRSRCRRHRERGARHLVALLRVRAGSEIDAPKPTVLGAHELTEGGSYFILPTTSYGLYRITFPTSSA
jgi:hypothetical protein